jgi:hypothetical protein
VPVSRHWRVLAGFLVTAPVPIGLLVATTLAIGAIGDADAGAARPPDSAPARAAARRSTAPRSQTVSLAWVGDITPGSMYGTLPGDGASLFGGVRSRLKGHDLTLGNLEGTIGATGVPKCARGAPNCFSFQAPPRTARGLARAGFDVVNVANNHAFDYGEPAYRETLSHLHRARVRPAGLPGRVRVVRRRGLRIAIVGFSTYRWTTSMLDPEAVRDLVARAGRHGELVVVLFHGGAEGSDRSLTPPGPEEYLGEQRGDVRAFARTAIDAGADVVLGSGPHVLRGMEVYRRRVAAYSMGNFAGVRNFSVAGDLGLSAVLSLRVERSGAFRAGYLHPLILDASGRPAVDPRRRATRFVRAAGVRDFGASSVRVRAGGKLLPPSRRRPYPSP